MKANTTGWVSTGSTVSGLGYGYSILRNDAELGITHGAYLAFHGHSAIVPAHSYREAREMGEAFATCWRKWNVVQARERALSNGIAVLGGKAVR